MKLKYHKDWRGNFGDDLNLPFFEKYLNGKKTIIIGGPPCQPFSKNGYWIKNKNRKI